MVGPRPNVIALAVVLACLVHPTRCPAEDPPAPDAPASVSGPTRAEIEARIKVVEADTTTPEPVRARILETYRSTLAELERLEQTTKQASATKRLIAEAPARAADIERDLAQPLPDPPDAQTQAGTMSAAEVNKRLTEESARLSEARDRLTAAEAALSQLRERPARLSEAISKSRVALEEIETQAQAPPPADETPAVTEARRTLLDVRRRVVASQLQATQSEQAAIDTIIDLRTAERDTAARHFKHQERIVASWRPAATRVLVVESARDAAETQRLRDQLAQEAAPDELLALADDLVKRLGQLQQVQTQVAEAGRAADQAASRFEELKQEFDGTRERMQRLELDEQLGRLMRLRQRTLANYKTPPEAADARRRSYGEAGAAQLDIDDLRRALPDREARVQAAVAAASTANGTPRFTEAAPGLISGYRQTLEKLHRAYGQLVHKLGEWIETTGDTERVADLYGGFIAERLFWIRSSSPPEVADAHRLARAVAWLFAPRHWVQVGESLLRGLHAPVLWVGVAAALVFLWFRRPAHKRLTAISADVGRLRSDSFLLTLRALLLTIAVAAGGPLLVGAIGWQLTRESSDFAGYAGGGMVRLAVAWFLLAFLRALSLRDGVGAAHFRWPDNARRSFKTGLFWVLVVGLPVVFIVTTVEASGDPDHSRSLGRFALCIGMVAFACFFGIVMHPRGAVLSVAASRSPDGWTHRTRLIWYPLLLLTPAALLAMAVAGYDYTAQQLAVRVRWSIWLVAGLTLLSQLLLRWLNVTHRRIAFMEALRKREAARKEAEAKAKAKAADGSDAPPPTEAALTEPDVPIEQLSENTRVLLRTMLGFAAVVGLYLIWQDVTPALNRLDKIELWTYSTTVQGVAKDLPITLINLISAVLVTVIAVVAARNLPGVVELVVLNRLPIDTGARYAISSVTRYAITGIGIVIAFRVLGVGWTDVQWLVAALSIGLGFGLQEIIANFVSGLILLFERPIRVGDVVTIGDVTGSVSKIRIRATTIIAWDQRELIVPNKEFITGRLLNWTLSTPVNRLVINVGIAYGSDTRQAYRLLLEAAAENPLVLKDPPPRCNFDAFGDNALNFVLRVFLPDMTNRMTVIHELHTSIDDKFRAAGIAIAFPQRDVHLDTSRPLELKWADAAAPRPEPDK